MIQKSILITGCSSGIGYACAKGLQARGWRVFATVRNEADKARLEAEGFEVLVMDYADSISVRNAAALVGRRCDGKLDALFNNGAYGQPGAVEDISRKALEEQFAANFFGWHELTVECLPYLRASEQGRIINCSSVLGLGAMKWRGAYNASKFAIEGLTDTMRLELKPHGIKVSTIEPGPIATRFVEHALAAFARNINEEKSHYGAAYEKQRARMGKGGSAKFKLPPEAVLAKLIHALESRNPKAHYYVTVPTYIVALARRFLPQRAFDKLMDRFSDQ